MIKAVVFDMGGVMHTVEQSAKKQLEFAQSLLAYLRARGIAIEAEPEAFAQTLALKDDARRTHNEQTKKETPPLEAWTQFYLKDYGVTAEAVFPIADELCFRWSKDRGIDKPREGMHACLQALREQGMRMGIISNTLSRTYVPWQLSQYKVSHYFEYVLLSSVCGLRKPGAEIFDLCMHSMQLKKEELAYVGDTISRDVIGVRAAGWQLMIRLLNTQAKPKVVEREQAYAKQGGYEPDYTIHSLLEIPKIIEEYNASL